MFFVMDSSESSELREIKRRRKILKDLVTSVVSDRSNVDLEPEDLEKFMKCVRHQLKESPQIFIYQIPMVDEEIEASYIQKRIVSKAFTSWLLSHLLQLLLLNTENFAHVIQTSCTLTFVSIFNQIESKDPVYYRELVVGVINVLGELVEANEAFYDNSRNVERFEFEWFKPDLEGYMTEDDMTFKQLKILVKEPEECEVLQLTLTRILRYLIRDFASIVPYQSILILWRILCFQVENCDLDVKEMSLNLLAAVIQYIGIPFQIDIQDNYLDVLASTIGAHCMGQMENNGDTQYFEVALAKNVTNIIKHEKSERKISEYSAIRYYEILLQAINDHGLELVRTDELFKALCSSMMFLFSFLMDLECAHKTELSNLSRSVLIKHFIPKCFCEWTSQCFVNLVKLDLGSNITEIEQQNSSQSSNSSQNSEVVEASRFSQTWEKMGKKLQLFAKEDYLKKNMSFFEEFKVCVITGSLCSVHLNKSLENIANENRKEMWHVMYQPVKTKTIFNFIQDGFASQITSICFDILISHPSTLVYCSVLEIVASFLYVQDKLNLSESLAKITAISSLLWFKKVKNVEDTVTECFKQLSSIEKFNFTERILELSLWILAVLPDNYAVHRRIMIFRSILVGRKVDHQKSALKFFPILMFQLKNYRDQLLDLFSGPKITSFDSKAQIVTAEVLGKVSCVMSDRAFITRETLGDECDFAFNNSLKIRCSLCDFKNDNELIQLDETQPPPVDPTFLGIFFTLIPDSDKEFKLAFIKSLKHAFRHLPLTPQLISSVMVFLDDPELEVRLLFSRVFSQSLRSGLDVNSVNQTIVIRLKQSMQQAEDNEDIDIQETILDTVGYLGRVVDGELLVVVVVCLLEKLMSSNKRLYAAAYVHLKDVERVKKRSILKLSALFTEFHSDICRCVLKKLFLNLNETSPSPDEILTRVAKVFDYPNVNSFFSVALRHLIPPVMVRDSQEASSLLKIFAKFQNEKTKQMIVANFRFIFAYVACSSNSKDEMEKALQFVHAETRLGIDDLIKADFQRIHNELLMKISTHYTQVYKALTMLATKDEAYGSRQIESDDDLADFLHPRLLGFFSFFDYQLLSSSVSKSEKLLTLKSVIEIVKLMKQRYITPIRMKVVATLRIALRLKDSEFIDLSCTAWITLIENVDLSALGQMMSQIVVTLLPLLPTRSTQVANIFRCMIVEKEKSLKNNFCDLHFMPDIPELIDVNAVLNSYNKKSNNEEYLRTVLDHSLKGINHENLEVRVCALSKLKSVLHDFKISLHKLILTNETVDPIITRLINSLMIGCRDPDYKVRTLIGECLGELGAVDPGKLGANSYNLSNKMSNVHTNVRDENFAFDVINELLRTFLAAEDTRTQDCSSYAIQELLRIFECKDTADKSKPGTKLWNRFPANVQEILGLLQDSHYALTNPSAEVQYSQPIYGSCRGSTFKDWVVNWSGYLISKITEKTSAEIFGVCSVIIKHDIKTALYILPDIIIQTLVDGTDQVKDDIYKEFTAVLSSTEQTELNQNNQFDVWHMSTQTVFSILDYLTKWIGQIVLILRKNSKSGNTTTNKTLADALKCVQSFLKSIPLDTLANASFQSQAYTRALMLVEAHIKSGNTTLESQLGMLQKLYVVLDEPDGMAGVTAVRQNPLELKDRILIHESTCQYHDALTCYEKVIRYEPDDLSHYHGILRTFMILDQPDIALNCATGALADKPEWTQELNQYRIEAAWKLGNWSTLDEYLEVNDGINRSFNVGIGQILMSARSKKEENFMELLQSVRCDQMAPLSAASMELGAYQRGYDYLIRLHMLNEVEKGLKVFSSFPSSPNSKRNEESVTIKEILDEWDCRIKLSQDSLGCTEPILSLRRVILLQAKNLLPGFASELDEYIGHSWLESAKVARKCGHLQRAYSCLLETSKFNRIDTFLERAKWHWAKGEKDQAMLNIETGIEQHYKDVTSLTNQQEKLACAKAKLLLTRYKEQSSSTDSRTIIGKFRQVLDIYSDFEDVHFYLAQYYDRVIETITSRDKRMEVMVLVVKHYGISLQHGCHFIYHSMPRMLSVWFDVGNIVAQDRKKNEHHTSAKLLDSMNKFCISAFCENLPAYQFLTAFSQLISRICHSEATIFEHLKEIIAKILVNYPQQAMWLMMAVSKSSHSTRVRLCRQIFDRAIRLSPNLEKFLADATKFVDLILELCNRKVSDGVSRMSMQRDFRKLVSLLEDENFSRIMLPLQSAMTVNLPSTRGKNENHNPFPNNVVYIRGFQDLVQIMPSLQKPKKISLRGSDGKVYEMMCKPKDDLRKDCRLMEFNNLVNKLLLRDTDARRRQLLIRTYTVVPLNEECGLIEWVPNLIGLRPVLVKLYEQKNKVASFSEVKRLIPPNSASVHDKLAAFRKHVLPRYPPVLSEWFLQTFLDPTAWYSSRLSYARTLAVMSMVGYILGLGDRHGENILLDSSSGDVVHVDFNCLFNKGLSFEVPEVVPFRLTQNMVDALGPTGVEGIFRKSCEVTLRIMREQMDTLMSVLKPFIHDPLVEWKARGSRRNPSSSGEIFNEMGFTHVQDIIYRLQGVVVDKVKPPSLPLSVEGQVNYLITEATSQVNLCQMYIGWAAYL